MTRTSLFKLAVMAAMCVAASGCWGSASESPWPAEPADVDLGPAGEAEATADPKAAQKPTNVRQPATSAKKPAPAPKSSESKP